MKNFIKVSIVFSLKKTNWGHYVRYCWMNERFYRYITKARAFCKRGGRSKGGVPTLYLANYRKDILTNPIQVSHLFILTFPVILTATSVPLEARYW